MAEPKAVDESKEGDIKVIHPPLKFVVVYSGFKAMQRCYEAFYEPLIKTPVLHFIGQLDSVVEEKRSRALVDACVDADEKTAKDGDVGEERVVYHPGGHFVPSQRGYVNVVVEFIRKMLGE